MILLPKEPVACEKAPASPLAPVESRNWPPLSDAMPLSTSACATLGDRAITSIGTPADCARSLTSARVAALAVSPPSLSTSSRAPLAGSAWSSPARMPSYSAVLPPAFSPSMAASTSGRSVVGSTATSTWSLKVTRPTSTALGMLCTKVVAALRAAASCSPRMDPLVSKTITDWVESTPMDCEGRGRRDLGPADDDLGGERGCRRDLDLRVEVHEEADVAAVRPGDLDGLSLVGQRSRRCQDGERSRRHRHCRPRQPGAHG